MCTNNEFIKSEDRRNEREKKGVSGKSEEKQGNQSERAEGSQR